MKPPVSPERSMRKTLLIIEREHPPDLAVYRAGIEAALGDQVEVRLAVSEAEALAQCGACTAVAAKAQALPASVVAAMPWIDWVQALTSGVDPLASLGLPDRVTITSMRGIHGPQMAELAVLFILALTRELPRMLADQAAHRWERRPQRLLHGRTVLIVGVGLISEAIAARCAVFGMRVIGASGGRAEAAGFDRIYPYAALADAAAEADVMVVVTPYSPAAHHLVSGAVLARMKPTALVINIARGNVVDEAALLAALRERRLAGAGLDVFAAEPLPSDSPFWTEPNVIVTPHIGGMSESYAAQAVPVLVANLRAYCAGQGVAAMVNVVRAST